MDSHECILGPYLVEAITRCIHDLSFMVICSQPEKEETIGYVTFEAIIREWMQKDLVDKTVVKICGKSNRGSSIGKHYKETKENGGTTYEIYTQNQYFTRHKLARGDIEWNERKGPTFFTKNSILPSDMGDLDEIDHGQDAKDTQRMRRTKGLKGGPRRRSAKFNHNFRRSSRMSKIDAKKGRTGKK